VAARAPIGIVAILLATYLAACRREPEVAKATAQSSQEGAFAFAILKITRGPCFGECPVYQLEVHADGFVKYVGRFHVLEIGLRQSRIEPFSVGLISDALVRSGFFDLPTDCCTCKVTDADDQVTTIEVTRAQGARTLEDIRGCPQGAPRALKWLEDVIVYLAEADRWIGPEHRPRAPGW
jgi:hypothetical protein